MTGDWTDKVSTMQANVKRDLKFVPDPDCWFKVRGMLNIPSGGRTSAAFLLSPSCQAACADAKRCSLAAARTLLVSRCLQAALSSPLTLRYKYCERAMYSQQCHMQETQQQQQSFIGACKICLGCCSKHTNQEQLGTPPHNSIAAKLAGDANTRRSQARVLRPGGATGPHGVRQPCAQRTLNVHLRSGRQRLWVGDPSPVQRPRLRRCQLRHLPTPQHNKPHQACMNMSCMMNPPYHIYGMQM